MAQCRFKFTGEISLPNANSKRPFCKLFEKEGQKMASMNLGIKESKNNIGFVEIFGAIPKNGEIKTKDTDGNDITVKWGDRLSPDVIKTVAYYKKYIVDLGKDNGGRKEFISPYDMILYLKDTLPNYTGHVCVTGQLKKQPYQDRYLDKFEFQNIYAVDSEEKTRLNITADIYYNKSCINKDNWKTDKVIELNGYIEQYISEEKENKFIPQDFIFNASKIDPNNEKHVKLLNHKLKYIDIKNKKWGHLLWEITMINGAEEIEFDESQLTDAQKEQIELGIKTLDDFKPNGSIFGKRKNEYRLVLPSLVEAGNDDFRNGFIDLDESDDEFNEKIYVPVKNEKLSEVMKESEAKDTEDEENNETEEVDIVDDDDLFS